MLYNKGNLAKLKYVQLQPSPSRVKMVAKFIRRGIRVRVPDVSLPSSYIGYYSPISIAFGLDRLNGDK